MTYGLSILACLFYSCVSIVIYGADGGESIEAEPPELVQELVEPEYPNLSPLMRAVAEGDDALTRKLLEEGANPLIPHVETKQRRRKTRKVEMEVRGGRQMVRGPIKSDLARSQLQRSKVIPRRRKSAPIVGSLLVPVSYLPRRKISTEIIDNGSLPLHIAVRTKRETLIRALLDHERVEQIIIQDHFGNTPLHIAASLGNWFAVDILVHQRLIDPDYREYFNQALEIKNYDGDTPLAAAFFADEPYRAMQLLLNHGANPDIYWPASDYSEEKSLAQTAREMKKLDIFMLLVKFSRIEIYEKNIEEFIANNNIDDLCRFFEENPNLNTMKHLMNEYYNADKKNISEINKSVDGSNEIPTLSHTENSEQKKKKSNFRRLIDFWKNR